MFFACLLLLVWIVALFCLFPFLIVLLGRFLLVKDHANTRLDDFIDQCLDRLGQAEEAIETATWDLLCLLADRVISSQHELSVPDAFWRPR